MLDFFVIMFSGDILQSSAAATNESQEMSNDPLSIQEFLKFLGLMLAMTSPLADRRAFWDAESLTVSTHRTTMVASCHFHVLKEFCGASNFLSILQQSSRFVRVLQSILQYFQEDPWIPIRVFVDDFNDLRKKIFLPGTFIAVDESMSSWKGKILYFNKASDEDVSRVSMLMVTDSSLLAGRTRPSKHSSPRVAQQSLQTDLQSRRDRAWSSLMEYQLTKFLAP